MAVTVSDRIEKRVHLAAPRARVWKAITDSAEFGKWFGAKFDGPFVAGQPLTGVIQPTTVDAAVARKQQPYAGMPFDLTVDRIEPERLFSFRWHPSAADKNVDPAKEPTTLVAFMLEDAPGGTVLTVTESGFDRIPEARRAKAFEENDGGWTHQMKLIEKYLTARA